MKNPFASTDNIFEKIGKREPTKREPLITRGGSTREQPPIHTDKMQFGGNLVARGSRQI